MLNQLRKKRDTDGFTLIELLIVIIILGILAAVVVLSINAIRDRGAKSACQTEAEQIRTALAGYYSDNGSTYPSALDNAGLRNFLDKDPSANWVYSTTAASFSLQPSTAAGTTCANSGIGVLTGTTGI